ncbi:MAG: type II toxin-antitoxin system RelE/ParE family toxin [Pseudomonadota bacterium]
MLRLIITKPAEQHLEKIARWTLRNWGEAKVEEYKHGLNMGLCNIMEHSHIGKDASDIRPNYRKLLVGEHWIFYEVTDEAVIVHGFLGVRQKPEKHL